MEYKATKVLAEFTSEEYGIAAVVAEITSGFSVAIRDTDAGEYFPVAKVFNTFDEAVAAAKAAVA